jgi:hypothetical protein
MNGWVGEGANGWVGTPTGAFQIATNRSQIRQPDRTFVFIEEHPDSINDGYFVVDVSDSGPGARLIDFPAAYHHYGANLGFADGSAQYRQWLDPRTSPNQLTIFGPLPNDPDVTWLQSVTTYRK